MTLWDIIMLLLGLLDLAMFVAALTRHWRITLSLLAGLSLVVGLGVLADFNAFCWIMGFHLLIAALTVGIVWDQKKGARGKKN